jgi:hypothetical protein
MDKTISFLVPCPPAFGHVVATSLHLGAPQKLQEK